MKLFANFVVMIALGFLSGSNLLVFGGLIGMTLMFGYMSRRTFRDSATFPLVLAGIGLLMFALNYVYSNDSTFLFQVLDWFNPKCLPIQLTSSAEPTSLVLLSPAFWAVALSTNLSPVLVYAALLVLLILAIISLYNTRVVVMDSAPVANLTALKLKYDLNGQFGFDLDLTADLPDREVLESITRIELSLHGDEIWNALSAKLGALDAAAARAWYQPLVSVLGDKKKTERGIHGTFRFNFSSVDLSTRTVLSFLRETSHLRIPLLFQVVYRCKEGTVAPLLQGLTFEAEQLIPVVTSTTTKGKFLFFFTINRVTEHCQPIDLFARHRARH